MTIRYSECLGTRTVEPVCKHGLKMDPNDSSSDADSDLPSVGTKRMSVVNSEGDEAVSSGEWGVVPPSGSRRVRMCTRYTIRKRAGNS
jgi:hypothetical protein